jgi:predicted dienelactone hydrolase
MSTLDRIFVVVTLTTALWWALSRLRRPQILRVMSIAALVGALATIAVEGIRWQLVPWQAIAVSVSAAAALRHSRPGRSRRWRRVIGRTVLMFLLAAGGLTLLTAFVPVLPQPSGPHRVGSEIFRWTDTRRAETLTPNTSDKRQVIVQAWYPTDARKGRAVPYFEAQKRLPATIAGLPSWMYRSFGNVNTHAVESAPVSRSQGLWPVLFLSPGLSVPREQYTALSVDLASRGYVVIAMSSPYESSVAELAGGRVVGQTVHPDVMGPPPHPDVQRLIDIRTADSRFVLDKLDKLATVDPASPLVGHLDLRHVGFVGHSIGGATAVQTLAADPRFKVGVDLDGKLFGAERTARLQQPFLWIQSDGSQTAEYRQGLDSFIAGLHGGGDVLTVRHSVHMSFTDSPAYMTAPGRKFLGGGTPSAALMTSAVSDAVTAFVGPVLGVRGGQDLDAALNRHPALVWNRRIAPSVY